jgi:hypothetical protein
LFTLQKLPDDGDAEDYRTYAATALFPALWSKLHSESLGTMDSIAGWLGSTGEYPYTAIANLILEIFPIEPTRAQQFFLQGMRLFRSGKTFPDSNRMYVDFLIKTKNIPNPSMLREAIQQAVDAIDHPSPLRPRKEYGLRYTKTGLRAFVSEEDYLLSRLLPLIKESNEMWFMDVMKSHPSLRGDEGISEGSSRTAVGALVKDTGIPQRRVREAMDTMQIRRAVDIARTDPKQAFAIVNAISSPQLRDIGLASILPRCVEIEPKAS